MKKLSVWLCNSFVNNFYWWIFAITTLYTGSDIFLTYLQFHQLFYVDTDCYTHATRLLYWLQHFQWYEQIYPFSNYPFGEVLHFTRLLDLIWGVLTIPFLPFFSIKDAVFYAGMLLSPLCLFLSLLTIFWGLKPYIKPTLKNLFFALMLSLMFFAKFDDVFDFTRPDHHSVITLFFAYNISAVLLNLSAKRLKILFFAGILAGFGIWISSAVEGVIFVAAILGILCLSLLKDKISISALKIYSLGLFIATAFAFLLNPPYKGYLSFENTRLSAIHVVLTGLICLSFYILAMFNLKSATDKICGLGASALASLGILCLIFGTSVIFTPVYDEYIKTHFIPFITEMKPFWKFPYLIEMIVFETVLASLVLFYKPSFQRSVEQNLVFLFGFFVILLLSAQRFIPYELCVLVYLNILFTNKLFSPATPSQTEKSLAFGYIYVVLFLLFSFKYEPLLPQNSSLIPQNSVVLTDIYIAPQLIFDRNVKTVGIPYHSAIEGISDTIKIFSSTSETEIKQLLQKHQVQYIFYPYNPKTPCQEIPCQVKNTSKFAEKVATAKEIYSWMKKIDTNSKDVLYKIDYQEF